MENGDNIERHLREEEREKNRTNEKKKSKQNEWNM